MGKKEEMSEWDRELPVFCITVGVGPRQIYRKGRRCTMARSPFSTVCFSVARSWTFEPLMLRSWSQSLLKI